MTLVVVAAGSEPAQLLLPVACALARQGNHVIVATHRQFVNHFDLDGCGIKVCVIGSDAAADQVTACNYYLHCL